MEPEKKEKRRYQPPAITRVELDAKCAVLGFCQNTNQGGPVSTGCGDGFGGNCYDLGS